MRDRGPWPRFSATPIVRSSRSASKPRWRRVSWCPPTTTPRPDRAQRRRGGRRASHAAVQGRRCQARDSVERQRRVSFAADGKRCGRLSSSAGFRFEFDDPHFAVYANVNGEAVTTADRAKGSCSSNSPSRSAGWTKYGRCATDFPTRCSSRWVRATCSIGLVKKIAPSVKAATCGTAAEVNQLQ